VAVTSGSHVDVLGHIRIQFGRRSWIDFWDLSRVEGGES